MTWVHYAAVLFFAVWGLALPARLLAGMYRRLTTRRLLEARGITADDLKWGDS